jgi:hypothetical protein
MDCYDRDREAERLFQEMCASIQEELGAGQASA